MALDKTKLYGEVFGQHRAHYVQDGKYFDVHGDEINPKPDAAEPEVQAEEPKKRGRKPQ